MSDRSKKPEGLPEDLCSLLLTKTMHLNPHYRRSSFEDVFTAHTATYHCIRTMISQGPDGDDVLPAKCRPGRCCYEGANEIT